MPNPPISTTKSRLPSDQTGADRGRRLVSLLQPAIQISLGNVDGPAAWWVCDLLRKIRHQEGNSRPGDGLILAGEFPALGTDGQMRRKPVPFLLGHTSGGRNGTEQTKLVVIGHSAATLPRPKHIASVFRALPMDHQAPQTFEASIVIVANIYRRLSQLLRAA